MDKSLQKGTLWTLIFFLSSFAKTVFLTPLMLHHWGLTLFGFWAIILSARAIILFLSDGFVRYIVNQYNISFHLNEHEARYVLASGLSFLGVFSLLVCVSLGLIFYIFPQLPQYIFGTHSVFLLPLCLIVYILAASLQNIQRMYAATQEARGLVWHNLFVEVLLLALELLVLSWLIHDGRSFTTVLFINAALIVLISLLYIAYIAIRYPLPKAYSLKSVQLGAQHFTRAIQLYASNFFEKMATDGLVLLLSFFRFDKAAIALFATVRTIINTPLLAQNLLLNTYTPQVQKDFALRNEVALAKLFKHIRLRVSFILLVGIICCYPLYEPVFVYWTKGKIEYNHHFVMIMLLLAVFNLYGLSFAFVFKALNVLPQLLGIMILKLSLLLLGFALVGQSIDQFAWVLVLVEAVVSLILLPWLLQRFWRKEALVLPISDTLWSSIGYLLAAFVLYSLYLLH